MITCDLTDVQASIYYGKTAAGRFDTIHEIIRSLGPVQAHLKGKNAPAGTNAYETAGNRRVKCFKIESGSHVSSVNSLLYIYIYKVQLKPLVHKNPD